MSGLPIPNPDQEYLKSLRDTSRRKVREAGFIPRLDHLFATGGIPIKVMLAGQTDNWLKREYKMLKKEELALVHKLISGEFLTENDLIKAGLDKTEYPGVYWHPRIRDVVGVPDKIAEVTDIASAKRARELFGENLPVPATPQEKAIMMQSKVLGEKEREAYAAAGGLLSQEGKNFMELYPSEWEKIRKAPNPNPHFKAIAGQYNPDEIPQQLAASIMKFSASLSGVQTVQARWVQVELLKIIKGFDARRTSNDKVRFCHNCKTSEFAYLVDTGDQDVSLVPNRHVYACAQCENVWETAFFDAGISGEPNSPDVIDAETE